MATTITNIFSGDEPILTSRLGSVRATTDQPKVNVIVIRDPDGEASVCYATTLHAYLGMVEFSALGKLVEESLRQAGKVYDSFSISFDNVSTNFVAIYCEYDLDADFDYRRCFFCASGSSIVHDKSTILLPHWNNGSENYHVQVVGIGPDGEPAVLSRDYTKQQTSLWVSFPVMDILDFALNRSEIETEDVISKVVYFTISHGEMQKVFYLAEDPYYLTFRFRNIFNAPEYLDVVGTVKRKTAADRSLAVCEGRAVQYNRSVNRTFEVQTAALTDDQIREVEQMITSHHVELCAGDDDYPILITDHSCEVSSDDESLSTMKFTFRFADSRPTLWRSEMGALLPSNSHIFSHEYSHEFA